MTLDPSVASLAGIGISLERCMEAALRLDHQGVLMPPSHAATGLADGSFGIATLTNGGSPFPTLVLPDGAAIDLSRTFRDTHAIFDAWERNFDVLREIAGRTGSSDLRFETTGVLAPLAHPNMLCAGANHRQHVIEMLTHGSFNQHNRRPDEDDAAFWARNARGRARNLPPRGRRKMPREHERARSRRQRSPRRAPAQLRPRAFRKTCRR